MKDILITQQKIKEWEKEKATLEARIKADQEHLHLLTRRLENLSLYIEEGERIPVEESVQMKLLPSSVQNLTELNPPYAIAAILKTLDRPLSAGEIKAELKKADYPVEKFGKTFSYLYTLLGRMAKGGRIVNLDGKYKLA